MRKKYIKVTNDFNEVELNVLKSDSFLISKSLGKFKLESYTGSLLMRAIENCYLAFLDLKMSRLACSYIPHLENLGFM